ncbi:hypothetical protein L3X38_027114 [Prunus dulcis]|uniref:Uncharacterized protein n=1 Tax=Prunus dulcis TaxID=3755 RepID=A0AAD4VNJ5_PRUDU|nr:hypothetical protein L3X38_027114 [Prunus dulcis]
MSNEMLPIFDDYGDNEKEEITWRVLGDSKDHESCHGGGEPGLLRNNIFHTKCTSHGNHGIRAAILGLLTLASNPHGGSYQDNPDLDSDDDPELESDDDLEPESDNDSDDDYGWLINSLEQSLIGNFIRFPTAKAVWDAIATTYYDGTDTSQVYDLRRRVSRRVYIFLDGLDDHLDKARSDVLHMTSFPTVDQAYAYVRREDVRQAVMIGSSAPTGAGLAAKNGPRSGPHTRARQPYNSSTAAHLQIQSYATAAGAPPLKTIPPSRPKALTDGSG